jgi:hypothetical protein
VERRAGRPDRRNKLWFFGAFRKARYDRPIANTFSIPAGRRTFRPPSPRASANPGGCEQGVSDEKMDNPVVRLTWQASERNKFAVYMDRALRLRGHAMGAFTDQTTASVIWNTPTFATGSVKWTSTLSSRALLELGFSGNRERYDNLYQPGILAERNTPAWYQNVRKNDVSTGLLWNAPARSSATTRTATTCRARSRTSPARTPSRWAAPGSSASTSATTTPMPISTRAITTAVPFQVTVLNTPLRVGEDLDANFGVYAQDTWSLNRLTLNLGLRFDLNKQTIRGQEAQVGRFANSPQYDSFAALPTWRDFSPRLSAVYDLSGNGRTACASASTSS